MRFLQLWYRNVRVQWTQQSVTCGLCGRHHSETIPYRYSRPCSWYTACADALGVALSSVGLVFLAAVHARAEGWLLSPSPWPDLAAVRWWSTNGWQWPTKLRYVLFQLSQSLLVRGISKRSLVDIPFSRRIQRTLIGWMLVADACWLLTTVCHSRSSVDVRCVEIYEKVLPMRQAFRQRV